MVIVMVTSLLIEIHQYTHQHAPNPNSIILSSSGSNTFSPSIICVKTGLYFDEDFMF